MRMKKMNVKKKDMICVLVIRVPLCSHPIDVLGAQTVIEISHLEEVCKKIISIYHFLEGN